MNSFRPETDCPKCARAKLCRYCVQFMCPIFPFNIDIDECRRYASPAPQLWACSMPTSIRVSGRGGGSDNNIKPHRPRPAPYYHPSTSDTEHGGRGWRGRFGTRVLMVARNIDRSMLVATDVSVEYGLRLEFVAADVRPRRVVPEWTKQQHLAVF